MRQPRHPAVLALTLAFMADPRTAGAALLDPTRPAIGGTGNAQVDAALNKALQPAAQAASAPAPDEAASAPTLQGMHLPKDGREATAIVDGQILKVGGKLGQYEVTQIDAQGLLVKGPAGRERWTLAGVEILDSRAAQPVLKHGPLAAKPGAKATTVAPRTGLTLPPDAPLTTPTSPAPAEGAAPTTPPPAKRAVAQVERPAVRTVAWQMQLEPRVPSLQAPAPAAAPRTARKLKPVASPRSTWTADGSSQRLRLDLADMRRQMAILVGGPKSEWRAGPVNHWHSPLGPKPGHWLAAWAPVSALAPRATPHAATTHLMLTGWQPKAPNQALVGGARSLRAVTTTALRGPMPDTVLKKPAVRAWMPAEATVEGLQASWQTKAPAAFTQIAALQAKPLAVRQFAKASSAPPKRWSGPVRWAQAKPQAPALAVVHSYPQALPNWQIKTVALATTVSADPFAFATENP